MEHGRRSSSRNAGAPKPPGDAFGGQFQGNAVAGKEAIDGSDKPGESGRAIKIKVVVPEMRVKVSLDRLRDGRRTEFEKVKDDEKIGDLVMPHIFRQVRNLRPRNSPKGGGIRPARTGAVGAHFGKARAKGAVVDSRPDKRVEGSPHPLGNRFSVRARGPRSRSLKYAEPVMGRISSSAVCIYMSRNRWRSVPRATQSDSPGSLICQYFHPSRLGLEPSFVRATPSAAAEGL
ncbi:hypothetical protein [Mesorhizobium sp. L48C026A00]|uniref:hypothetical protein n=1 Tax=Mesorhizobium sp. L48C026A00 TaxID=1287182 RepID=UPI0018DCEA28|nr:hypothetical protein [Mesorhizobium sp. L48C026A00]